MSIGTIGIFRTLLNHTFAVWRRMRTADGQGGWQIEYAPVGDVLGRMRPMAATEEVIATAEGRKVTHRLYVEALGQIRVEDEVVLGELVVEVLAILEPSQANHHWEILCEERQVEGSVLDWGS